MPRRNGSHPRRIAALAAAAFFLAVPRGSAQAEDPPAQKLKAVEKALEEGQQSQARYAGEAEALAADLALLREQSVASAQALQQNEATISALEDRLARLTAEETAKTADLERRSGQSVELLMALQRLARHPPEALAFAPGAPIDTARSALLLGAAIPQLQRTAQALRGELVELAGIRSEIDERRQQLLVQSEALAKEQLALRALTLRKAVLQEHAERGAEMTAQRVAQLSTQASDLRDLIERLEAEAQRRAEEQRRADIALLARAAIQPPRAALIPPPAPKPEPPAAAQPAPQAETAPPVTEKATADIGRPKGLRPFASAQGALLLPVAGKVRLRYGDADEFGAASKGIVIEARPGGQVVAPFDGRIEFAGPFRGYGQILIIEHGDGYHSLLAGLEHIDGAVGQWLVAGEPVGTMPADGHNASLYLELRLHGQPINPLPWLATHDDKVSG